MPHAAGDLIRAGRRKRGLKIGEFARRVRISSTHLDNVEAGRKPASIELLNRIADELDLPDADALIAQTISGREPS